jgi:cell division protein ZapA
MPQVSIRIANRTYELACGAGEQERVRELANYVDEKVGELQKQMPTAPEIKLMVFAALLMAEEAREARTAVQDASSAIESASETADTLAELITARVDKISKKVSGAA